MARKKKTKYEKVAKYLSDHPLSAPKNVAKACKCSVKYVYNIRSQSGTPKKFLNVRQKQIQKHLQFLIAHVQAS